MIIMIVVSIILFLLLCCSVAINLVFAWYIKRVVQEHNKIFGNLEELLKLVENYNSHVEEVHNLEQYHFDNIISNLLKHSQDFTEDLKVFIDLHNINPNIVLEELNTSQDE